MKRIVRITINIGFINFVPFLRASLEPIRFPAMPKTAPGMPIAHKICPLTANVTKAAMLEARFTTFALPEAVRRSNPAKTVKPRIRNVPVPGPKNPS